MKARDIMSSGTECVAASDTLEAAARRLAKEGVGSMPICGDDDRLTGMLTDRDIVVRAVAGPQRTWPHRRRVGRG